MQQLNQKDHLLHLQGFSLEFSCDVHIESYWYVGTVVAIDATIYEPVRSLTDSVYA